jgi:hypothetical protein
LKKFRVLAQMEMREEYMLRGAHGVIGRRRVQVNKSVTSAGVDAETMPSLDAFDNEFGRENDGIVEDPPPRSGFRLSTVIGLALAAGIISALALGWPSMFGASQSQLQPEQTAAPATQALEAAVSRLSDEVASLRRENQDLRDAQRRAADTIAALQAGEGEGRGSFVAWYTNPAALAYGIAMVSDGAAAGRRSVTARPRPREGAPPPRDDGAPMSLDPPQ